MAFAHSRDVIAGEPSTPARDAARQACCHARSTRCCVPCWRALRLFHRRATAGKAVAPIRITGIRSRIQGNDELSSSGAVGVPFPDGSAGVRAILNFATVPLAVPPAVEMKTVNMALELETLTYALAHR